MNTRQHCAIGVGVGLLLNLFKQGIQRHLGPNRAFNWVELAGYGIVGGLVALVPDMVEPATHSNHRGFFHSVAFGGIAVYATDGKHTQAWDPEAHILAQTASWMLRLPSRCRRNNAERDTFHLS